VNLDQPKNSKLEAVIEGIAHELGLVKDKRLVDDVLEPCIIVIIGASGIWQDANSYQPFSFICKETATPFTILGCSRTGMRDEDWRARAKELLRIQTGFSALPGTPSAPTSLL